MADERHEEDVALEEITTRWEKSDDDKAAAAAVAAAAAKEEEEEAGEPDDEGDDEAPRAKPRKGQRAHRDDDDDAPDDDTEGSDDDEDPDAEDSDDPDDADDPDDDEQDEDDEDDPDEQDDDEDSDDEDNGEGEPSPVAEALKRHGWKAALEKLDDDAKSVVEARIRELDKPFTRAMMEATEFRRERDTFRADQIYREQNPDLVIVEMIAKAGKEAGPLIDAVQKRLNRLGLGEEEVDETSIADNRAVINNAIKEKRAAATEKVVEANKDLADRWAQGERVEKTARRQADRVGVPFNKTLARLLAAEIFGKPEAERGKGLTDDEIKDVVTEFARDHRSSVRANVREDRKRSVKDRSADRKKAPTHVRRPKDVSSPGASRPTKEKVKHGDVDSELAAMDRSAKKILGRQGNRR